MIGRIVLWILYGVFLTVGVFLAITTVAFFAEHLTDFAIPLLILTALVLGIAYLAYPSNDQGTMKTGSNRTGDGKEEDA